VTEVRQNNKKKEKQTKKPTSFQTGQFLPIQNVAPIPEQRPYSEFNLKGPD
jgi:hypothetical protein